ncbi:MAG: hypothetical protein ACRC3B_23600, partial [Bacteroidia bacterium]
CTAQTTGTFATAAWQPAMSAGAVTYMGTWNAQTNTPALQSSVGTKGQYYVVTVSGSTSINGLTDWQVGDWIINNGTVWQKVDNSDSGSAPGAGQVVFTPAGVITSANVQAAIEELQSWTASQLSGKTNAFTGQTANIVSFDAQQRPVDSGLSLGIVPRMNAGAFTSGNFVMSNGTNVQADSGLNASSFLTRTNTDVYVPTANYHPSTKKYVDDAAQLKFDKPTEEIPSGNFLTVNPSGVPIDSGVNSSGIVTPTELGNYLSKTNSVVFTPTANYHPATKKYIDDVSQLKLDKPAVAVPAGNFLTVNASGVPVDSGVNSSGIVTSTALEDYLSKNNTEVYTPTTNYHPSTKKYVDDAAQLKFDKPTEEIPSGNFLTVNASGVPIDSGVNSSGIVTSTVLNDYLSKTNSVVFTPTANYHPSTKKYVDDVSQLKLDKPAVAVPAGNFLTVNASGVPVDSGVNTSGIVTSTALDEYLKKTNTDVFTPTANY